MHPQFPQDGHLTYLNHAGVGPWPQRTCDAITRFAQENVYRGAADYPSWLEVEHRLRERLAALINVPSSEDVALVKNTSEGLSFIAYGLDWQAGDEIVISRQEFPSNRVVWESLEALGVNVMDVDLTAAESPEEAIIQALGPRTRLLSVSSVQYGTGLRMDLERLASACRAQNVLLCVDAIQSLGALQFDLQQVDADFVVADGHKWMLGPEGLGLFYCRASLRDQLRLTQYGWHMLEHAGDFDRNDWEIARTARRFESGSPNSLGVHGLEASLSVLQDAIGMQTVEEQVLANTAYLAERIASEAQLHLLSDPDPQRHSGIVTFNHRTMDSAQLHKRLMQAGVICAQRGGGIRFSSHCYQDSTQLDKAVDIALELAGA